MPASVMPGAPAANADNISYVKLAVAGDLPEVLRETSTFRSAVYRVYAANRDLLYIGASSQLDRRMLLHRSGSHWWPHATELHLQYFANRPLAFQSEEQAIATEGPLWNVKGNGRYFDADLVAAREAYGAMPERFRHPGRRPALPPNNPGIVGRIADELEATVQWHRDRYALAASLGFVPRNPTVEQMRRFLDGVPA